MAKKKLIQIEEGHPAPATGRLMSMVIDSIMDDVERATNAADKKAVAAGEKPVEERPVPKGKGKAPPKKTSSSRSWLITGLMRGSDDRTDLKSAISTGSKVLDLCITQKPAKDGRYGIPAGRISEWFSELESAGKSALAEIFAGIAQALGYQVTYDDIEGTLDKRRAAAYGANMLTLLYRKGILTVEELFDAFEGGVADLTKRVSALVREHPELAAEADTAKAVFIQDTLASLETKYDAEHGYDDNGYPPLPRAMSKALRKFNGTVKRSGATLIIINQGRIDYHTGAVATPGGKAVKFYATTRLKIEKIGFVLHPTLGTPIGIKIRVTVIRESRIVEIAR